MVAEWSSLGALALYIAGVADNSPHLKGLAFLGFLINLFNLLPVVPLDGGRISAALHPAMWLLGFLALIALVIYRPNPLLIIILLFAASELRRRWTLRHHPHMQNYYRVKPAQRAIVGLLYFGLAAALVLGMHATQVPQHFAVVPKHVGSSGPPWRLSAVEGISVPRRRPDEASR